MAYSSIGACLNGDPLVIDVETLSIGYIEHDELWSNDPIPDPQAILIDTGLGIGAFVLAAVQNESTFPSDAHEAQALEGGFTKHFPVR